MTKIEIIEFLENYRDKKTLAEFKIKRGESEDRIVVCVKAIEDCMKALPDGLGEILKDLYFYKQSLRKMAEKHYSSKNTIAKRRNEAIDLMSVCLSDL